MHATHSLVKNVQSHHSSHILVCEYAFSASMKHTSLLRERSYSFIRKCSEMSTQLAFCHMLLHRVLDAELEAVLLSKAAQFGLPAKWVSTLDKLDPDRRQVLRVRSTVANSPAAEVLQSGDMLLAVGAQSVSSFRDVETLIAATGKREGESLVNGGEQQQQQQEAGKVDEKSSGSRPAKRQRGGEKGGVLAEAVAAAAAFVANGGAHDSSAAADAGASVALTIFRSGAVQEVELRPGVEDGMGTDRLLHWCGAQLQAPHRAVRELGFLPAGGAGVYISRWHHGSPAHRYGLYALHWILEVNGVKTPDLDTFLSVVEPLQDGDFARVKVCHLETTQNKVGRGV